MIQSLRRCAVPAGLIAAAVLVPAPAHAAPPQPEKFSFTEPFTDTDFCGTGETVEGTFSVKGVMFLSPKNADFAEVARGKQTFTFGGTTVIGHFAGRFTRELVSVGQNGERTIAFTAKGLPESFRLKGGGLLTRDAGTITFLVTLDENGELISETFTASGPHPQADSGFTLFCDVIPEALGIEQA
jgi:hypothetical protein